MKEFFQRQCIIAWLLGLLAFFCACMVACSPVKKLNRLAAEHPEAAAAICARMYPVRESTDVRIETRTDTQWNPGPVVFVDCDSARLRLAPGDTSRMIIAVPCPPMQLIRTLVTKDSIVRVENTAALAEARGIARAAELRAATVAKSREVWRIAALAMATLFIIAVAMKWLRKLI